MPHPLRNAASFVIFPRERDHRLSVLLCKLRRTDGSLSHSRLRVEPSSPVITQSALSPFPALGVFPVVTVLIVVHFLVSILHS